MQATFYVPNQPALLVGSLCQQLRRDDVQRLINVKNDKISLTSLPELRLADFLWMCHGGKWRCTSNLVLKLPHLRIQANMHTRHAEYVSLSFCPTPPHPPCHPRLCFTHTQTHSRTQRRHTWEGWRRAVCSASRSIVINCGVNRGSSTSPALRLLQGCRARLCSALHNGTP